VRFGCQDFFDLNDITRLTRVIRLGGPDARPVRLEAISQMLSERGPRASHTIGARRRRGARERVSGEPRGKASRMRLEAISQMRSERVPRASHAIGARRRRGARERVSGSPRGEAPRLRLETVARAVYPGQTTPGMAEVAPWFDNTDSTKGAVEQR